MKQKLLAAITRLFVRPFRRGCPPSKKVAIVIPMSTRAELTEEEEISKRQLVHHLGSYDKILLVPEGMELDFEGFRTMGFPGRYFGSASAHSKLLGTRGFYRRFLDYDYIFFYHLDSLAFSDNLKEWCDSGLDYIGPPWIKCDDSPWVDRPRVGNGGFTLLRVESALTAITNRYLKIPSYFWYDLFTTTAPEGVVRMVDKLESMFPNVKLFRRLMEEWRETDSPIDHNRNNDIFWSDVASYYFPEFKVASVEQGLRFGFEVSPRFCLELNGGQMPFGCHAWARYDRKFWEPFLVGAEESVEKGAGELKSLRTA